MPSELNVIQKSQFIELAVKLATNNVVSGTGGPFGAVIVKDGVVIATGVNCVTASNDPTAHAEVVAIREACKALGSFQLEGCEVFASCEPCPMCLGAIYWARPSAVYYAATQADAEAAGFDDSFIYRELATSPDKRALKMVQLPCPNATVSFDSWRSMATKVKY